MIRPYRRQAASERADHPKDVAGEGFQAVVRNPKLKLLDQVREVLRLRHYSIRTERQPPARPFLTLFRGVLGRGEGGPRDVKREA